jgi:hypothetical protein
MQNDTARFTPVKSKEQKVEVNVDGDKAVIKLSTWVEGLGWCCQKTMSMDLEMLEEMQGLLAGAKAELAQAVEDDEILSASVLEFSR